MNKWKLIFLMAIVIVGGTYSVLADDTPNSDENRTVRWLVAHQPFSVFDRADETFARVLAEESNGSLQLKRLEPSDVGLPNNLDIKKDTLIELMDAGQVDIGTAAVTAFEEDIPETRIFDVPFAFSSYDDIKNFFASEAGKTLLGLVSDGTSVQALDFTFSGGFRNLFINGDEVNSLNDIAGDSVVRSGGLGSKLAISLMGINEVGATDSSADGVEASYTRVSGLNNSLSYPTVIESRHGVLATMILANDTFVESLTPVEHSALLKAAAAAAVVERADSEALANATRNLLEQEGKHFVTLTDSERDTLREAALVNDSSLKQQIDIEFIDAFLNSN